MLVIFKWYTVGYLSLRRRHRRRALIARDVTSGASRRGRRSIGVGAAWARDSHVSWSPGSFVSGNSHESYSTAIRTTFACTISLNQHFASYLHTYFSIINLASWLLRLGFPTGRRLFTDMWRCDNFFLFYNLFTLSRSMFISQKNM